MGSFDNIINNDPQHLKNEQKKLKELAKEKDNYRKQDEVAKKGPLEPHLTMGNYTPNTKKVRENLKKDYDNRVDQINKQAREDKLKRAKELSHLDPTGYEKWQKKQDIIQIERERIKQMKENQRNFERER